MNKFDLDQKVSSYLAFCLILILGFIVAWNALSVGATLVRNAPDSNTFNPARNVPE